MNLSFLPVGHIHTHEVHHGVSEKSNSLSLGCIIIHPDVASYTGTDAVQPTFLSIKMCAFSPQYELQTIRISLPLLINILLMNMSCMWGNQAATTPVGFHSSSLFSLLKHLARESEGEGDPRLQHEKTSSEVHERRQAIWKQTYIMGL